MARKGSGKRGGNRKGYIAPGRRNVYDALRRQGASKSKAAAIANSGTTHAKRSASARKAARTRAARGRKR
ncbi:hypothetical protein EV383_4400 [Pseudonocardia sediminis]|uniref:Uncharacterized protein n=1 Tax=Pseudonocardia sediminis TaxID=1397368 RepID=A0A4Q7V076_PSEST|nr:hypothetical protein EV383_4400 [Pseudonocardia sediminis]